TKPRVFAYVASVAGYRGLPRALTYGPGKAGLISFAESLWVDLKGLGLNTWIINPGFVRTRLTAQNTFSMPALIEPEEAASSIIRGFAKGHFEIHFPARFSWFMKLLRMLPIHWYLRLSKRLVPSLSRTELTSKPPSKME
ncbi:MAG: SDR family NAD(P)-dependent oxidoreductase, partial [Fluviibacter sp.]